MRGKQLASFQVGMLSALLRTLDLRDQMTARHSAAVARYSRAIAQRAGFSREEEELVHIAALLHDIGKFILPDRILKANVPLTDEDWMLIKRHPQQGARVVSSLDGYGPVAEIILAHHERIDGKGYPRGLKGEEIPKLSRIISVSDTYDVMTARDSYRTPMSSPRRDRRAAARRRQTARRRASSRSSSSWSKATTSPSSTARPSDFEKELALESRIAETASPDGRLRPLPGPARREDPGRILDAGLAPRRRPVARAIRFAPDARGHLPGSRTRSGSTRSPILRSGPPTRSLLRVEASGICGSDLHIYHGRVPVEQGFTIGHEYVGTVLDGGRRRRAGRGRRPGARLLPHRLRDLRRLPARRLPPLRAPAHLRPRLPPRRPAGRPGRAAARSPRQPDPAPGAGGDVATRRRCSPAT